MAHDIFISYSTKDQKTADAICHVLEENNLKCWIAPRDISGGTNYAEEIMNGLKQAKIVVLVFSKNSQESLYVNNEIHTAFSHNKPIISFKIDETLPEDKMEFYLKTKHWLEAYPEPELVFKTLVNDALRLCEKRNIISNTTNEDTNQDYENNENNIKKKSITQEKRKINDDTHNFNSIFKKYKIPLIIIALLVIVSLIVFNMGVTNNEDLNSNNANNSNYNIKITDINVYNDSNTEYNEYWNYSYFIYGKVIYPSDVEGYKINTEFIDSSGKIVDTDTNDLNEIPSGEEELIAELYSEDNSATKVVVKIVDKNNKVVTQDEKEITNK